MGRLLYLGVSCRPNQPLQYWDAGRHGLVSTRGSMVLQRPPQLNFAFGHLKIDVTGFLRRKLWRGSACIWGIVPEPAVAVDAGRHTGFARFHGSIQRPPQ